MKLPFSLLGTCFLILLAEPWSSAAYELEAEELGEDQERKDVKPKIVLSRAGEPKVESPKIVLSRKKEERGDAPTNSAGESEAGEGVGIIRDHSSASLEEQHEELRRQKQFIASMGLENVAQIIKRSGKPIERTAVEKSSGIDSEESSDSSSTSSGHDGISRGKIGSILTQSKEYVAQNETDETITAVAEFACSSAFSKHYR